MSPPLPRIPLDDDDPELSPSEVPPPSSTFRCFDCGKLSPPTRTGETLVSSRHGWRAERVTQEDGFIRIDWRCATCWTAHRARKLASF